MGRQVRGQPVAPQRDERREERGDRAVLVRGPNDPGRALLGLLGNSLGSARHPLQGQPISWWFRDGGTEALYFKTAEDLASPLNYWAGKYVLLPSCLSDML